MLGDFDSDNPINWYIEWATADKIARYHLDGGLLSFLAGVDELAYAPILAPKLAEVCQFQPADLVLCPFLPEEQRLKGLRSRYVILVDMAPVINLARNNRAGAVFMLLGYRDPDTIHVTDMHNLPRATYTGLVFIGLKSYWLNTPIYYRPGLGTAQQKKDGE